MENFVVSARKYRPVTFDTVVGQSTITDTLKNAIRNNQLAQAFLFCGPRGVGKTTCARILAKVINCENPSSGIEPCNKCVSCKAFNESASFNIHELDAASNNGVDEIRSLVDQVRIPPQMGRYKVYIIDEVHMLTAAAFNAFLKTLEEPPSYAKFILATTEKHKIIPTILSRCQIFDFKRITINDIARHLAFVAKNEGVTAEPEALLIIAQKADGALRDALTIFDQMVNLGNNTITREQVVDNLNVLDYEYYFNIVDAIVSGNYQQSLLILNEIIDKGFDGQHFITGFGEHLRNLLMCKDEVTVRLLEVGDSTRVKYVEQARQVHLSYLFDFLDIINKEDVEYRNSNFKKLSIEVSLVQMCNKVKTYAAPVQTQVTIQETSPAAVNKPLERPVAQPTLEEKVSAEIKSPLQEIAQQPIPAVNRPVVGTGFSLKDSINKANDVVNESQANNAVELRKNEFSNQMLIDSFRKYAARVQQNSSILYTALTTFAPELRDNFTVIHKVSNSVMEKALNEHLVDFVAFLKNDLENDLITVNLRVEESVEEAKKFLTDKEKLEIMMAKNPEVKNLKDQLNLELDL